jgi:xanthine phosphoribosyltransferase
MQLLKDRIVRDGVCIGAEIIKVDSFLNHQIDVTLLDQIGEAFYERFKRQNITKILTIEASGIAVACMTARYFRAPVVFAKKTEPSTMTQGFYSAEIRSFTKNKISHVIISKEYLNRDDQILIIDDFLAHGEALGGLINLTEQAGATVCGAGIVIEKAFQGGGLKFRKKGLRIESLAIINSIKNGVIYFADSPL